MADVIGGGIAGISAAAELARGGADVTVLEAEPQIGYQVTGRTAAIFICNYGNATLRALNALAKSIFEHPGEISDRALLSPRGELMVAAEEELPSLTPTCKARPASTGRLARRLPISFQSCARVVAVRCAAGRWQVETAQGMVAAPIVVNVAGGWADEVAGLAEVARAGLQPYCRSAALIPTPDGHDTEHWPIFGSLFETWYAKPEAGKLMVSPADEDPVDPHDAWADDIVLAEG